MVVNMNLKLYKSNKIELEYSNIKALNKEESISFIIDNIKTTLNNDFFIRENNEFKFVLDIKNKSCIYIFKEKGMTFDIAVENLYFKRRFNYICLIYKIETDEEELKIEINLENGE